MTKNTTILVAATAALLASTTAARAERSLELGGFAGAHLFNDDNELGVVDASTSTSLDNAFTFGLRLAVELTSLLDIEGELAIAPTTSTADSTNVVAFGWRAHALFHIGEDRVRPFLLLGAGASTSSSEDTATIQNDTDFVMHAGAGVKVDIDDNWGLRFDGRMIFPPSSANESVTTDAEFLIGVYKNFGWDEVVILDDDGDGIRNEDDTCPDKAEDMDGHDDLDGCPEDEDSDGDGMMDPDDECPNEAEDMDGFKDDDGCPEADNDGDGIDDAKDGCPLEPEDMDGFEDTNGCPEADNDGDGIVDTADKCPLEAETKNGFEDSDGCPDEVPEQVKAFSGKIEGIRFQHGSAKIRPVSFKVLDKAVAVFTEYPELRFEIQGHTDNSGTPERNMTLSQERAQSVLDYFVSKGIAAERMVAKGYGQEVTVGDNATAAGREANRRVEFKLLVE